MKRFWMMIALGLSACSSAPATQDKAPEALSPASQPSAALAEPKRALTESIAKIKRNGTLSQLLRDEKVSDPQAWISALGMAVDVRKLRATDAFHFFRSDDGVLVRLVLDRSVWERAVVEEGALPASVVPLAWILEPPMRLPGGLASRVDRDVTAVKSEVVEIEVTSSLYQAIVDAGWDPSIAYELADVFAWDLDFYSDVQRGDRAIALVDVRRRDSGEFIGYGKLHGAIYVGQAGRFSAFRYVPTSGDETFYDENGRSLRKEFLKSPLKFAHVTSKFGSRRHPVLGYTRQHAGVDFSASIGTPVWAIGDGKVTFAGWQGGYGKFVTVRHPNGLESAYAHLSAINVRVGQRVAQKTVIGSSGNTGLSSGPHLHFGLKRGGAFINPFSLKPVRIEPLAETELPRFKEAIGNTLRKLGEALQQRS